MLLTCHHVIPTEDDAKNACLYFGYTNGSKSFTACPASSILDTSGQWFWTDPTYRDRVSESLIGVQLPLPKFCLCIGLVLMFVALEFAILTTPKIVNLRKFLISSFYVLGINEVNHYNRYPGEVTKC